MFHSSNCCRLCINVCNVYQSLYHVDGRKSEVYHLMDKYFPPMFLNMERGSHLTVICTECWRHIFEFHKFQQSVLLAQRSLAEVDQQSAAIPLARDDQQSNTPVTYTNKSNAGSVATIASTLSHYDSNLFCVDDEAGQRLAVVKSEIETPLQETCPNKINADMAYTNPFYNGGVRTNIGEGFDNQLDQHSITVVKSEVDNTTLHIARNNNLTDSIATASSFSNKLVHTSSNEDIKNTAPMHSQNPGIVDSISILDSSDNSDWEEIDEPIGAFIDGDSNIKQSETTDSESFSETESEWSDDEMSLMEYATGQAGENSSTSQNANINTNFSAELQENKSSSARYRRLKTISYKQNLKRLKTVEEFDDFIAKWRPNLECLICSVSCPKFTLLLEHFEKEHPNEKCHIQCCQLKLYQRYDIEKHIHYHQEPLAFKCDVCFKCFTTSKYLRKHIEEKHSGKPKDIFKCPTCAKCYLSEKGLQSHVKIGIHMPNDSTQIQGHACSECGKVYKTLNILRRHKRKVHINPRTVLLYKCTTCDKCYSSSTALKVHMSTHTGKNFYNCPFCPKTCRYRKPFNKHMKTEHPKEWEERKKQLDLNKGKNKRYKCNSCENVYKTPLALREHKAVHVGKDLYTCQHCSKPFKYSSNLAAHLKRIHPIEWKKKKGLNSANNDILQTDNVELK